jgi:hypothetical protein
LFYFPLGTKMFQFPSLPPLTLCIQMRVTRYYSGRVAPFGHPRITARNGFPWHFAVYCVLHRLLAPRYPPCALRSLTNVWILFSIGRTPKSTQTKLLVEYGPQYVVFRVRKPAFRWPRGWPRRSFGPDELSMIPDQSTSLTKFF